MRYVLLAMLLLAGCTSPSQKFATEFPKLKGQPIAALYDRWGRPERVVEPEVAKLMNESDGGPVYVWNSSKGYAYTSSSTSTGFVGATPVSITTTTPESSTVYCTVRVRTDEQRRISNIELSGSRGACERFSDRL